MSQTAIAIVLGSLIIAMGTYLSVPRYEIVAIANSTNPGAWKLDRFTGEVMLCATGNGKDSESGCSAKLKQF